MTGLYAVALFVGAFAAIRVRAYLAAYTAPCPLSHPWDWAVHDALTAGMTWTAAWSGVSALYLLDGITPRPHLWAHVLAVLALSTPIGLWRARRRARAAVLTHTPARVTA